MNSNPLFITVSIDTFDPLAYDVYLGGKGYRVASLSMDTAPAYIPRFNTGEQGENDLDMLKIEGNDNYEGGMFQQDLVDNTQAKSIINGYVNPDNKQLYNTPAHSTFTTLTGANGKLCAWAVYRNNLIVAIRHNNTNTMWKITNAGVVTQITLPTELLNAEPITQLHHPRNTGIESLLIFSTSTPIYRYDNTTVTTVGLAGSVVGSALKNKMYTIDAKAKIYLYNFSAGHVDFITNIGPTNNLPTSCTEFNSRLWVGTPNGIYTFDGVTSALFAEAESLDPENGKYYAVMHGWMYFNMDGYIWRHNSVTLERLKDMRDTKILGMSSGLDRIWIHTTGGSGSSVIEREGWDVNDTNIWTYDSVGWFLYNNKQKGTATNTSTGIAMMSNKLYTFFTGGQIDTIDLTKEWQVGAKEECTVISSVINNGFPNILKYLEAIEVNYEDLYTNLDQIFVSYRYRDDNGEWSFWIDNLLPISTLAPSPKSFFITTYKNMQYKLLIKKSSSSLLSIRNAVNHYTPMPPKRKRWNAQLICAGTDYYSPELLKDGTHEKTTPKQLRDIVYQAHWNETPVIFLTSDYCILDTDIDDHEEIVINVKGTTHLFTPSGSLFIGTEILHYDSKTENSFSISKREGWNSTATPHAKGEVISQFSRVFVENIISENYQFAETNENNMENDPALGLETVINVQITEVNTDNEF